MEIITPCRQIIADNHLQPAEQTIKYAHLSYLTRKVPRAQKSTLHEYQQRASLSHPNVPMVFLDFSSPFYLTVHVEDVASLKAQELQEIPISKRITILMDILKAVDYLARTFGFFYLLEGMVGRRQTRQEGRFGELVVWINTDLMSNYRKRPIQHGSLSEEIFVQDFKAVYASQLMYRREFEETKSIYGLLEALAQRQHINQSLCLEHPTPKANDLRRSLINFNRQNINITVAEWRKKAEAKGKQVLSFSKLQFRRPALRQDSYRRLHRKQTVESVYLDKFSNYQSMVKDEQSRRASIEASEVPFARKLVLSTSCSHFTNIPSSPTDVSFKKTWKPFENHSPKQVSIPNTGLDRNSSCTQSWEERLKFSFPHTTTNSFIPFASNGNLALSCNDSDHLEKKMSKSIKQEETPHDQKISEEQNDVEMELDCLFSRSNSSENGGVNLENLVHEFEQMLQA